MQRRELNIKVEQFIRYHQQNNKDEWKLETKGTLVELKRNTKMSYYDDSGLLIEVKWYKDFTNQHLVAEIKQPHYTLMFNPSVITNTSYQTPQGLWKMEVDTQQIQQNETENGLQLLIKYQIIVDNQTLGDYEFRLHYGGEIGNI